jgi:DNA-damage-inducible protein J
MSSSQSERSDVMTTTINMRIDSKVKEQATKILDGLGIRTSTAVAMFFRQIVLHRGIPFEIRLPNKTTMQAIEELESGKGVSFDNAEDLLKDLKG